MKIKAKILMLICCIWCFGCFNKSYINYKELWQRSNFPWLSNERTYFCLYDKSRIDSTKTHIKVLGQEISVNGTFKIRYKGYGIIGHLKNGVPIDTWYYVEFPYFIAAAEKFKCGSTIEIGSSDGIVDREEQAEKEWMSKEFDVSLSLFKQSKKSKWDRQLQIIKRVRDKIHSEIYKAQFR